MLDYLNHYYILLPSICLAIMAIPITTYMSKRFPAFFGLCVIAFLPGIAETVACLATSAKSDLSGHPWLVPMTFYAFWFIFLDALYNARTRPARSRLRHIKQEFHL
jgi:hypothetical protein